MASKETHLVHEVARDTSDLCAFPILSVTDPRMPSGLCFMPTVSPHKVYESLSVTNSMARFCYLALKPENSLWLATVEGLTTNAKECYLGFIMNNDKKMPAAPKKAN